MGNNLVHALLTCPHCGTGSAHEVECKFGYTAERLDLHLGDLYPWVPRKAVHNGGRPPDGTGSFEGYSECPHCTLDFFVDVHIQQDRIVDLNPSLSRPGYKTAAVPGGTVYFRVGELDPGGAHLDYIRRAWYSKHLAAMAEPSFLHPDGDQAEVYRFLWLRTFHHPIAVRVTWSASGGATMRAVELDGAGGYEPGNIAASTERPLSDPDWTRLTAQLDQLGFWALTPGENQIGIDGSQWVFEGLRAGARTVFDRWSPGPGVFRDTGLLFLALGHMTPPTDEVY